MRLIRLCVIDTGEPIVEIIADEVAGGWGQGNVGQRSRFTSERRRHADHQPAEEKQRATGNGWIPGWSRYAVSGLLQTSVFIKASRKNLGRAGRRLSGKAHASALYFCLYNASFFPLDRTMVVTMWRFMRGVPVLASDSGYHPRSSMLPLTRSARHSSYGLICRNNGRNSIATTDGFPLLDRAYPSTSRSENIHANNQKATTENRRTYRRSPRPQGKARRPFSGG